MFGLSRFKSASPASSGRAFSLREVIEVIMNEMHARADEKNITLLLDYPDHVASSFEGDEETLHHVLDNLIGNAVAFSEAGTVTIGVSSSPINEGTMGLMIRIADTATTIAPEFRGVSVTEFATASRRIEQMNGRVDVENEPGKGSSVIITLPIHSDEADPAHNPLPMRRAEDTTHEEKNGHVLLVEDYVANVLVATALLEIFNYSYDTVTNGEEALERLKTKTYDAVLMDIHMQGLDGLQTTQRLRQWEFETNRPSVPVIAMTAYAMPGDRERCLKAGMDDYIAKPIDLEELGFKLSKYTHHAS